MQRSHCIMVILLSLQIICVHWKISYYNVICHCYRDVHSRTHKHIYPHISLHFPICLALLIDPEYQLHRIELEVNGNYSVIFYYQLLINTTGLIRGNLFTIPEKAVKVLGFTNRK